MWRSLRHAVYHSKISPHFKRIEHRYSTDSSSRGSGKFVLGVVAAVGAGFAGTIIYGKFEPKFRNILEKNLPFVDHIYKWLPDGDQKPSLSPKSHSEDKTRDVASGLLKKKLDREKAESQKIAGQSRSNDIAVQSSDKKSIESSNLSKLETKPTEQNVLLSEIQDLENALNENLLTDLIRQLQRNSEEALVSYKEAVEAVRKHTKALYEALELPEGSDSDIIWKDANQTKIDKSIAIKRAQEKVDNTKKIIEKLKTNLKKAAQSDPKHSLVKTGEESIQKVLRNFETAETEITSVEMEAKTADEYQKLVNASKIEFQKELEICVSPNYIHGDKEKTMTESDLNILIAHAHRKIEQLQKQLAKQQVTEKMRVDEALRHQKIKDNNSTESRIETELERRSVDLETAVSNRVATLKENFEVELRQQLRRQAAAHADHIQEVLKVQEQELERKYSLDLEEKLLHQKGVFISEVSGNMARLKGILAYLKAKSEFDKASKKAQTLWLACQSMSLKISSDSADTPCPLGKDIAAVKIAADEDNDYINSVLAGIPVEAVTRGVYTVEMLKQRFHKVKNVCRKVALIDENNDSIYRFILSYLQSFLIVDASTISKAELDGKVAVDPSEWDTYDILFRISYCLQHDDLEQALRYANQLKGEPRIVAKDWIKELRLLLETELAVKALQAHASAVGVQAYH